MTVKRFEIGAGERVVVIDRHSGSISREYVPGATRPDGGSVTGSVDVQGSRWLFRKEPQTMPLGPEVRVYKGFWDTLFRVTVIPDQDAVVTVR